MRLSAARAARAMDGSLTGVPGTATGVSIDTRTLERGDLFFAIRGPRHDGHAFLADAFRAGAAGAVVAGAAPVEGPGFLIRVADPTRALGALARAERLAGGARIVAVTGSLGKTTTKEAAAAALSARYTVFRSRGNRNNHWGLPLSLLSHEGEQVGVVELGMSAPGEIRTLAGIAAPDCGVITTIAETHLEFFDGIEGIAAAKGELYEALPPGATAVVNADDELVTVQAGRFPGRRVTYGFAARADVRGTRYAAGPAGLEISASAFGGPAVPVTCGLSGRHNAGNLLAGLAAAVVLEVPLERAAEAVRSLRPLPGRGARVALASGAEAIDDTYNASPRALRAVICDLVRRPARRRLLVAGDMLELGGAAEAFHRECGRFAHEAGLDLIVGVGPLGAVLAEAAAALGSRTLTAPSPEAAATRLADELRPGDLALFKASRGVGLEAALRRLEREQDSC